MASLDYKMYDIMDELSRDNRWDFLTVLILRKNKRNRCWPAMRTIAKKAFPGKTKECAGNLGMATRAKNWLMEHGAVTLVKPEHRIGAEKKLARNRHVYQLTGVIVIDTKVYPYLYNPGREHVSGDETTGDEDVSGAETSGDEISGAETSGGETNHLSVVSSINSNQESGSESSSSPTPQPEEEGDSFTDKEKQLLLEVFGSLAAAKQSLTMDRNGTLGWCEYTIRRNLTCSIARKIESPPDFVFRMVQRKKAVLPLPPLKSEETERSCAEIDAANDIAYRAVMDRKKTRKIRELLGKPERLTAAEFRSRNNWGRMMSIQRDRVAKSRDNAKRQKDSADQERLMALIAERKANEEKHGKFNLIK